MGPADSPGRFDTTGSSKLGVKLADLECEMLLTAPAWGDGTGY